jgi:hypothetical protein
MQPWPCGMPTSINPYGLPTAGVAHPGLSVRDKRHYWDRARELGSSIIQARSPELSEPQAQALIGQINFGTGQFGDARKAPFESTYCRWVPGVILDLLRPTYVILFGMRALLRKSGPRFDPSNRLRIDWDRPEERPPASPALLLCVQRRVPPRSACIRGGVACPGVLFPASEIPAILDR